MKGIVVEINNHGAAILSEDGRVVKLSNNNYQIGQEVKISMKKQINFKKVFAFASAAACILAVSGISAYAYYTPYTYVSLDVNPSIEYSVNRFEKVLSAKGVNDDGTEIINEINLENLKNKDIKDAISLTVDTITNAGYLDSNAGGIVITTSSNNMTKAGDLAQSLENVANTSVEENNHEAVVTAEAVGANRVAEARSLGVTPGKLNLVEKMIDSADTTDTINPEDWLHKSVKDIMAQTNEYKEQSKEQEQQAGETLQSKDQNENEDNNGKVNAQSQDSATSKPVTSNNSEVTSESDVENGAGASSNPNSNNSNSDKGASASGNSNSEKGVGASNNSNSDKGASASGNSNSDKGTGASNSTNSNSHSESGNNSNVGNGSNKKGD